MLERITGVIEGSAYAIGAGIALAIFFAIKRWWQKFYYEDGKLDKLEEKLGVIGIVGVTILFLIGITIFIYLAA